MPRAIGIVAVDAGSNAIRAAVARASSATDITEVFTERWPVRLGHNVFTHRKLDARTIVRAVRTFRHFRAMMRQHNIQTYRAVATSAVREAQNRDVLIQRIFRQTGIRLEAIDAGEEARLVLRAVRATLGSIEPRLVVDLGGGSLEVTLLQGWTVGQSVALPIGTVRLLEGMNLDGIVDEDQYYRLRHRVLSVLRSAWPSPPNLSRFTAVFCGGNAEALARLAPGPRFRGIPSIHVRLLRDRAWEILRRDVPARMRTFKVRRDRAEVMGIAAVVFLCLAEHTKLETLLVPGVGVREGILCELAMQHFGAPGSDERRSRALLDHARQLATRLHCDMVHAERVRGFVATLFDQLAPLHAMPSEFRLPLEMAALLHHAGKIVHVKGHHKHGEYLVRNAELPGLPDETQSLLACLVRYHGKSEPDLRHKLYESLSPRERRRVRALSGILRIAVSLDGNNAQGVRGIAVRMKRKGVRLRLHMAPGATVDLAAARRKARLFEKEFGVRVGFARTRAKLGAGKSNRPRQNGSPRKFVPSTTRGIWSLTA
ncbi:MAG TPA: Ppx/GppA phosphatase family protein [Candidatus Acidoferrales bacterium]|nr:Ppx/GppA phosphatase family protein [Candidatus Acidoferrales bacterium]